MKKSLRKIIVPILSIVLCLFCLLCACASPPPENNDRDTDNGGFGNGNDGHLSASAHEHDLSYVPDVAPECATAGSVAYWQCLSCGKYYADELAENELGVKDISLPAVGHCFKATVAVPTCTENGYALHKCEFCDESYIDKVVEKLGHDFVELATESSPTCTADGERKIKCSRCDQTTVEVLSAIGHEYTATAVAPTCTVDGYTSYKCSACGDEFFDNVTAARGHEYSSEWDRDDDSHWRAAICGCAISAEKIAHLFVDGRCETCGDRKSVV